MDEALDQFEKAIHESSDYPLLVCIVLAHALTNTLAEMGTLKELTGRRRNRMFMFETYLDLFEERGQRG